MKKPLNTKKLKFKHKTIWVVKTHKKLPDLTFTSKREARLLKKACFLSEQNIEVILIKRTMFDKFIVDEVST